MALLEVGSKHCGMGLSVPAADYSLALQVAPEVMRERPTCTSRMTVTGLRHPCSMLT